MKINEAKTTSENEGIQGIASKEFFSRLYAPFIGLMSLAGITYLGEAGSTLETILVSVAAAAGILGGVVPVKFLARNKMALTAIILLCCCGILSVLGQAIIFYTSYDISGSSFGWPLLAPFCIALGVIIHELSGARKSGAQETSAVVD